MHRACVNAHRGGIIASSEFHGQTLLESSMNRATHMSKLQPTEAMAPGRCMAFGIDAQLVDLSAPAQAGGAATK
jgi:hypothetical protein